MQERGRPHSLEVLLDRQRCAEESLLYDTRIAKVPIGCGQHEYTRQHLAPICSLPVEHLQWSLTHTHLHSSKLNFEIDLLQQAVANTKGTKSQASRSCMRMPGAGNCSTVTDKRFFTRFRGGGRVVV